MGTYFYHLSSTKTLGWLVTSSSKTPKEPHTKTKEEALRKSTEQRCPIPGSCVSSLFSKVLGDRGSVSHFFFFHSLLHAHCLGPRYHSEHTVGLVYSAVVCHRSKGAHLISQCNAPGLLLRILLHCAQTDPLWKLQDIFTSLPRLSQAFLKPLQGASCGGGGGPT